jgi:DHA3 family multidrug efflux protein-like MFS transporter
MVLSVLSGLMGVTTTSPTRGGPVPDPHPTVPSGTRRAFHHLLVSTLVASVVNFTVWFAVTFWVYLETRSVFATGVISGIYLVFTAASGVWFGGLVDRHRKRSVMLGSSAASLLCYAVALTVYLLTEPASFTDPASPALWALVLLLMAGVIVGNLRAITLSTAVTMLVPPEGRDRANGPGERTGRTDRANGPRHVLWINAAAKQGGDPQVE